MSKFYLNIKQIRIQSGLNQSEFGKLLGVKTNRVSSWERNETEPSYDILIKISHSFDISYEDLLL